MFSRSKHPLLTGAALLTAAGILSRVIGFFYRIFLSRTIGAQGLGIYQMIFPVYAFFFSLTAAGIQSAISRCCASARSEGNPQKEWAFFLTGTCFCVGSSCLAALFLHRYASWISVTLLNESRCCDLLKLLAFSLPFGSLHACISAWYYSSRHSFVPAFSQLLEQVTRVGTSYLIYLIFLEQHKTPTPLLAVSGILAGELAACLFCLLALAFHTVPKKLFPIFSFSVCFRELLTLSFPLTINRILVNFFQSTEAILIPGRLKLFGMDHASALSLYGSLTGMALPFILFPTAITSSFSTLLLPSIAGQQAAGQLKAIRISTERTIKYCLQLGILAGGIFFFFGEDLSQLLYQNKDAGMFLRILAFLCPFLYLGNTLTGILTGLGHTFLCLLQNLLGLGIRILFVFFVIPQVGIRGYLWGLLISQLISTGCSLFILHRSVDFSFSPSVCILKPCISLFLSCGIGLLCYRLLEFLLLPQLLSLGGSITVSGGLFFLFLFLWYAI